MLNDDLQTLVITYQNLNPNELVKKMNLYGNVIISNQVNSVFLKEIIPYEFGVTEILNIPSKGISNNRNSVLLNSNNLISILADDDMIFHDDYCDTVESAFNELPNASVIIFNIDNGNRIKNKKIKKVSKFNFMRYGASRICFKTNDIRRTNIWFHSDFGASKYGSGEDSIFLRDCLKKGLKIYTYPKSLAQLNESRDSTWFEGYTSKYFIDKGALFYELSSWFSIILIFRFAVNSQKMENNPYTFKQTILFLMQGRNEHRYYNK